MKRSRIAGLALSIALAFASFCLPRPAPAEQVELESTATARIVDAARALLQQVPEEPGRLEQMLEFSRAARLRQRFRGDAREDWSYWPRPRSGLSLGRMDADQRQATQQLLASVLGATGQLKVMHIVQLERILQALDVAGLPRELSHYLVTVFGEPGLDAPWGWRFEGHHVSINITVMPEGVRVTPSFLGANPAMVPSGPLTGFRALRLEEDLGRALVRSLSDEQRARAILSTEPPSDVLSGTLGKPRADRQKWETDLTPDGIVASELDTAQLALLGQLLDEVFSTYRPELVAAYRETLDVKSLHFAWLGGTDPGEPHYYRLQGGDFVFEYDNVQGNANHIHTVWRDRHGDFGADLLERHYRESH